MDYDVVVAGGGIAGLSAGLAAARLGRRTLVLAGGILGGQLLSIAKVEGYPGFPDGIPGYELCPIAQEQADAAGAETAASELATLAPLDDGWRIATNEGETHAARAVIIATGAGLKELGVPGEARLRGHGVSHCASCDAPLLRGRTVAVVGGGDSAAQEALTLAEAAARVIIFHRGGRLSAQRSFRERLEGEPKIEIRYNTVVTEVCGEASVSGLAVRDTASGESATMEFAGVFIYIGLQPNSAVVHGRLALDRYGRIVTDSAMRTAHPGICAVGAVRSGWSGRAVIAAGEGTEAALAIDRYLDGESWPDGSAGVSGECKE